MEVVVTLEELWEARRLLATPVGLVPTMGFLHEGHLSLVRAARKECAGVVVSIFVNPSQFGPQEDFTTYPRDLQKDLALLEKEGADLVWTPTVDILYPPDYQTWINVEEVSKPLEGAMRPGHFRGVATVVAKLFNATQPQYAYFGQKDAQQAVVIRQMARDLNYPLKVNICPTVREPDNLAMSSRNTYLDTGQRRAAAVLSRALFKAKEAFDQGERDANQLRQMMMDAFKQEPLAAVQYASCADPVTLQELEQIGESALLSVAVYVGKTRLIDNVLCS